MLCATFGLVLAGPAAAQVASSLLNEGDPYPEGGAGQVVSSLGNTAVNHAGGFALGLSSAGGAGTLSHIWGNASGGAGANIRTEGTFGSLVQTSFESFYGMDDAGSVAYSASGTGGPVGGFDSVWKDDTAVMVEGDPYPHQPNVWWRFGSRPGISGDGIPYFVGGLTTTQGGSTQNYGLFRGMTGMPVFVGGDNLPNLPVPLDSSSTISFDYRFSELANEYIGEVALNTGSTTNDNAIVVSGSGLMLGGSLVRELTPVPVSVGGNGAENWDNFDYTGITEAGQYFFTGDTDGDTATDEFILKDGMIVYREGDLVDGETLSGSIEGAYMNEDGDLAYIWDIQGGVLEALYLNDMLILTEGDEVDLDGDGNIDAGAVLRDFTGISTLTMSDRDNSGRVNVYFTADIDTAGTTSSTDDVEGFYCLQVEPEPTAIVLSGLRALPDLRTPGVTIEWSTSLEIDHDGFHVYRSELVNGVYERLTDELVRGRSPYSYRDTNVRPTTTYYYKIGAVDYSQHEVLYGPVEARTPDWGIRSNLAMARPNPFGQRTEIRFSLVGETQARLSIYDVAGRQVAVLVDEVLPAGDHSYFWDGRTALDQPSAGGVYFYRLETNGLTQTRKLVHIRRD